MPEGFITYPTFVTLTPEEDDFIAEYATRLLIPFDDLLRQFVFSAVRRHFELITGSAAVAAPSEEVQE